jgi:hypothetical protein
MLQERRCGEAIIVVVEMCRVLAALGYIGEKFSKTLEHRATGRTKVQAR